MKKYCILAEWPEMAYIGCKADQATTEVLLTMHNPTKFNVTSRTRFQVERFCGAQGGWQAETKDLTRDIAERRCKLRRQIRGDEWLYRVAPVTHTFAHDYSLGDLTVQF